MMISLEQPTLSASVLTSHSAVEEWLTSARVDGAVALIDKEEDWTSFDCVAKLRGLARVKRVGHAGTLDPLATGLLIVCFGKATKEIASIQDADKTYDVVVKFGATTATDDRGSDEVVGNNVQPLELSSVTEALLSFTGTIEQIPPAFSAIKHQGRRQYDLARKGQEFEPRVRTVTVHSITNVSMEWPFLTFTMLCTKGTYVRSIARDLGEKLGCGGYVHALRRTRIGDYRVEDAVKIGDVQQALAEVVPS
jgi:tRNA pseudouridine55 synthase